MFPTWLRSAPAWQGKLVQKPEKFERQQGDVYEATTNVLFLPSEMNFKLRRALSITWHMDTFARPHHVVGGLGRADHLTWIPVVLT